MVFIYLTLNFWFTEKNNKHSLNISNKYLGVQLLYDSLYIIKNIALPKIL